MNTLQWALLLLGVGIVVGLVFSSRREKKALEKLNAPPPRPVSRDWSVKADALPDAPPAAPVAPGHAGREFDEFGVGKPRKAGASAAPATAPTVAAPSMPPRVAPVVAREPSVPHAAPSVPSMVVGLYIAEHEGTNILGPKIHAALKDRGLRFGAKKIYHRYENEHPVFSVASLVKPGTLDPAEAEGFATPGLSIFLTLPGAQRPVAVFQDMLDTARGLARSLNAELYDAELRVPLSAERERALHEQVEDWARRYTAAGRANV